MTISLCNKVVNFVRKEEILVTSIFSFFHKVCNSNFLKDVKNIVIDTLLCLVLWDLNQEKIVEKAENAGYTIV